MIFAIVGLTLLFAHQFGDHWIQRHTEATAKGAPTDHGRAMCTRHVLNLTTTKAGFLVIVMLATGIRPSLWGVALALAVDGVSHYWADRAAFHTGKEGRRVTLEKLAHKMGKTDFWNLGKGTVNAEGKPVPSLGTGAYALDQSFHVLMIFIAALIVEVLS